MITRLLLIMFEEHEQARQVSEGRTRSVIAILSERHHFLTYKPVEGDSHLRPFSRSRSD